MVTNSRKTASVSPIRALNRPVPVRVQEDEACSPSAIDLGGMWSRIASIEDVWEIVDEWWRDNQIDRRYHRVILESGVVIIFFRDMTSGVWYRQRV